MMNGYWWAGVIGLLVVVLVALSAWVIVGSTSVGLAPRKQPVQQRVSAEEVLAQRLARGEIDTDEYRRLVEALKGTENHAGLSQTPSGT